MLVYLVLYQKDEGDSLVEVYSSREEAQQHADNFMPGSHVVVEEWRVRERFDVKEETNEQNRSTLHT